MTYVAPVVETPAPDAFVNGMNVDRLEAAELPVGQNVTYKSMAAGKVLGKIVATMRDELGDFYKVETTSRTNEYYQKGEIFIVSVGSAFLTAR